ANLSVIPAWFLLVVFPRKRITELVVHSYLYPFILGILYITLLVLSFGGEGGMDSLENLKLSFAREEVLVLGWVHYLVFDLFIAAWISRDSRKNHIAHLKIIPSLVLTLLLGPVGLLTYLIIRWFQLKKTSFL
ncbi:MAG: ABA4-like family protein, partial [Flavobacteriales bacterium]|nr:ABA4-like family protein [Flavobacteriales bacterium]